MCLVASILCIKKIFNIIGAKMFFGAIFDFELFSILNQKLISMFSLALIY